MDDKSIINIKYYDEGVYLFVGALKGITNE